MSAETDDSSDGDNASFQEIDWDEETPFRVLSDLGFYPYSGEDGDLFRKHGLAGWRVSVHGRHSLRIQKKGRIHKGRAQWNTKREWTTPEDENGLPDRDAELDMDVIAEFEESLKTLIEQGTLEHDE